MVICCWFSVAVVAETSVAQLIAYMESRGHKRGTTFDHYRITETYGHASQKLVRLMGMAIVEN